jgi:glycerol uptake facilitator-like aquaporin
MAITAARAPPLQGVSRAHLNPNVSMAFIGSLPA